MCAMKVRLVRDIDITIEGKRILHRAGDEVTIYPIDDKDCTDNYFMTDGKCVQILNDWYMHLC